MEEEAPKTSAEEAQQDKPAGLPQEVEIDFGNLDSNQQIAMEEALNIDFDRLMKTLKENEDEKDENGKVVKRGANKPIVDDDGKRIRGGHMNRAFTYAALLYEFPGITIEEAGKVPLVGMSLLKPDDEDGPAETD